MSPTGAGPLALAATAAALVLWPSAPGRAASRVRQIQRAAPTWSEQGAGPRVAVVAAIGGLAGGLLGTPLVAVLTAGGAAALAVRWTRARRARVEEQRAAGLGEALAALAAELRAGRPLAGSARTAAAACGDEVVGAALLRALRAPAAVDAEPPGAPLAEAGWRPALARMAAAVRLSERTGCSLAAVASAVEDDLRARRRLGLELRAALAAPRASAALLAGLPLLALGMGSGVGADPWGVLTTTGTGQVLLLLGVTLEVAGLWWSDRLVRRAAR